jgi:hypothetical protein
MQVQIGGLDRRWRQEGEDDGENANDVKAERLNAVTPSTQFGTPHSCGGICLLNLLKKLSKQYTTLWYLTASALVSGSKFMILILLNYLYSNNTVNFFS